MELGDYFLNGEGTQLVVTKTAEQLASKRAAANKKINGNNISVATENIYSSYHVIVRGTDGHKIFFKREDYCRFLFFLNRFLHLSSSSIYGFILMTNHAHLLIHSNCVKDVVCNLVKAYEGYFYCKYQRPKSIDNHKNNRQSKLEKLPIINSGPKLVNKSTKEGFKRAPIIEMPAKIIEKASVDYQLDTLYYIINNPILSGMCIRPGGYLYSSYLFYTKHGTFLSQFIDVDTSLIFDHDKTLEDFNKKRSKKLAYQLSTKNRKKCGIIGNWNEV